MLKPENCDPAVVADVLGRMARGRRFEAETEGVVLRAASRIVRDQHDGIVKPEKGDPTVVADGLDRMARGQRLDAETEGVVLRAASRIVREHHDVRDGMPGIVWVLWIVGVLAVGTALGFMVFITWMFLGISAAFR